ncbi:Hypothetical protein FKW44_004070 [Caligus rogercresseyi]|uniref:Uncharacterized protein n=1 Tax=Caligus rogercresseyi TaxID=217165 RepID=A0A7T8K9P2_CALRO|nr:Hypothetical protein FKW44_004070 [Caligus rogercresseyi]
MVNLQGELSSIRDLFGFKGCPSGPRELSKSPPNSLKEDDESSEKLKKEESTEEEDALLFLLFCEERVVACLSMQKRRSNRREDDCAVWPGVVVGGSQTDPWYTGGNHNSNLEVSLDLCVSVWGVILGIAV